MSFIPFLLDAAEQPVQRGGGLGMLIPLVLIVVIMYFFMIRPQNKKQKETQKMLDALKKGDKVVTIGGIHGTVTLTKENTVIVKVDDGAKIEFNRSAIATVVTDKPAAAPEKKFSLFGRKKKEEAPAVEAKAEPAVEAAKEEAPAAEETAAEEAPAKAPAKKTASKAKSTAKASTAKPKTKAKAKTEA